MNVSERIYTRDFNDGNFVEIWFNEKDSSLKEITLVSFNEESVKFTDSIEYSNNLENIYYKCFLEFSSKLEFEYPIYIYRSDISIRIIFHDFLTKNYFKVSTNCLIGIDDSNKISSIDLINIDTQNINNIFGF